MTGITPGDYKRFSWDGIEPIVSWIRISSNDMRPTDVQFELRESSTATADVKIIPAADQ